MRLLRALALLLIGISAAGNAVAGEIAAADLQIQGVGLKVVNVSVATGLNIPAAVQTEFGGKQNDQAPVVEGLLAVGELSGPGIDVPIRLETAPGQKFQIPGLQREGIYFLQNIRLMKGDDFLQPATPAVEVRRITRSPPGSMASRYGCVACLDPRILMRRIVRSSSYVCRL